MKPADFPVFPVEDDGTFRHFLNFGNVVAVGDGTVEKYEDASGETGDETDA